MTIDKSGQWWKGTEFADVAEYLRDQTADGYPADEVVQSVCTCGHTVFRLEVDEDEGCARRTCAACGTQAFICDSEEFWDEAEPMKLALAVRKGIGPRVPQASARPAGPGGYGAPGDCLLSSEHQREEVLP